MELYIIKYFYVVFFLTSFLLVGRNDGFKVSLLIYEMSEEIENSWRVSTHMPYILIEQQELVQFLSRINLNSKHDFSIFKYIYIIY